jgi:hypothetical protein
MNHPISPGNSQPPITSSISPIGYREDAGTGETCRGARTGRRCGPQPARVCRAPGRYQQRALHLRPLAGRVYAPKRPGRDARFALRAGRVSGTQTVIGDVPPMRLATPKRLRSHSPKNTTRSSHFSAKSPLYGERKVATQSQRRYARFATTEVALNLGEFTFRGMNCGMNKRNSYTFAVIHLQLPRVVRLRKTPYNHHEQTMLAH